MMLRLILVTCMTSSVLSIPVHHLQRRNVHGVAKTHRSVDDDYLFVLSQSMLRDNGGNPLSEGELARYIREGGVNQDTASHVATQCLDCCDMDGDHMLDGQELIHAMIQYDPLIFP